MDVISVFIMLNNFRKQQDLKLKATCLYNVNDTASFAAGEDFTVELFLFSLLSKQKKLQRHLSRKKIQLGETIKQLAAIQ